jgi:hypothetical protein
MTATLIADKFLANTWKLVGTVPGVYEHVHLGHYQITASGRYRVTAQFVTMALQRSGSNATGSYFTVKASLFLDSDRIIDSEVHGVISQFARWSVATSNPSWLIETDGAGELDIRFAHFAREATYDPNIDWLGVAGGANEPHRNGRTWFRVEPA